MSRRSYEAVSIGELLGAAAASFTDSWKAYSHDLIKAPESGIVTVGQCVQRPALQEITLRRGFEFQSSPTASSRLGYESRCLSDPFQGFLFTQSIDGFGHDIEPIAWNTLTADI